MAAYQAYHMPDIPFHCTADSMTVGSVLLLLKQLVGLRRDPAERLGQSA